MATQYTSTLKLALPVTGELSGTWGDVVNENITSMVEQAVAGLASINTWTTDSHTLTVANGTTSESRCAMLVLTDTGTALTGAATVVCPTASKIYIVKNTSGQTATIKTAAGTGVAIADDKTAFVFCDGTNVVEAVTTITGASLGFTSLTGTGAVVVTNILDEDNMASDSATALATQQSIKAYVDSQIAANNDLSEVLANGNTTGGTDIVVSTGDSVQVTDLTASVAVFTDASKNLVSNAITGTGNVVMSTSPTLVTPALGTPASGVVTNLTGTASININGTVGASTPSTGAFTTLSTSGVTNLAGLTASTALALDASKNVVSVANTGTGSNVLNTSPTLVTPALGTPASGVMTNVTGTATALNIGGNAATATNASTVTTNADLTGAVTSVGNAASLGSFTSAQLATALTDETGTGANVFATSPTLVTPALGTPASGVVTNLTGTASININGTVGASTPSTGAFTTLSASGTSTLAAVNASGVVKATLGGTTGVSTAIIAATDGNGGAGRGVAISLKPAGSSNSVEVAKIIGYQNTAAATANNAVLAVEVAASDGVLAERLRITNAGNVGIGTTSPGAYKLNVAGNVNVTGASTLAAVTAVGRVEISGGSGDRIFQVSGTSATTGTTQFGEVFNPTFGAAVTTLYGRYIGFTSNGATGTNAYSMYVEPVGGTSTFTNKWGLYVTGTDKNHLNGPVTMGTGLAVTGAISATEIISANKGITFPATQVASADANTLDDYEEGTWTPSVGGTATYSIQLGRYTKIGNIVHVEFMLTSNGGAGASNAITGLPFSAGTTMRWAVSIANVHGVQFNGTSPTGEAFNSSLLFYGFSNNATSGTADFTTFTNANILNGSCSYRVA